jgi:hypothetical protein
VFRARREVIMQILQTGSRAAGSARAPPDADRRLAG